MQAGTGIKRFLCCPHWVAAEVDSFLFLTRFQMIKVPCRFKTTKKQKKQKYNWTVPMGTRRYRPQFSARWTDGPFSTQHWPIGNKLILGVFFPGEPSVSFSLSNLRNHTDSKTQAWDLFILFCFFVHGGAVGLAPSPPEPLRSPCVCAGSLSGFSSFLLPAREAHRDLKIGPKEWVPVRMVHSFYVTLR